MSGIASWRWTHEPAFREDVPHKGGFGTSSRCPTWSITASAHVQKAGAGPLLTGDGVLLLDGAAGPSDDSGAGLDRMSGYGCGRKCLMADSRVDLMSNIQVSEGCSREGAEDERQPQTIGRSDPQPFV
jgi:hypothetical protein